MSAYNRIPTEKDLKKSLKKLQKDGYRSVHIPDMTRQLRLFIKGKVKSDIAITYHVGLGEMTVYNEKEMQEQMKLWKNLAKDGKIQIRECNNKEFELDNKKFHLLVLQTSDHEAYCPLALSLGMMVSGFSYAFTNKSNRDAVYGYIKKYCGAESDDEKESNE